jgi:hypothetical protein
MHEKAQFMALPKTGVIMNQYGNMAKTDIARQLSVQASSPSKRFMGREAESTYGFM